MGLRDLASLLDVGKLMLKEDVKPATTDFVIFRLAPMVFFAPVITAFVVLPFSPYLTAGALARASSTMLRSARLTSSASSWRAGGRTTNMR